MTDRTNSIFSTKSAYGGATFVEKLFFSWVKPFVKRAKSGKQITLNEIG